MIAQVDEQQVAVVALAMHPARQPGRLADMCGAQLAAGMGAVDGCIADFRACDGAAKGTDRAAQVKGIGAFAVRGDFAADRPALPAIEQCQ